jgi:uncharacterized protein (UPF0276 family)
MDYTLAPTLAGIGWRTTHCAELLRRRPALGFIEVHTEALLSGDDAALALLQQGRNLYELSLHGTGMSLESPSGINGSYLTDLAGMVELTSPWIISDHLWALPSTPEALDAVCANVHQVQDRLQRTIAVENLTGSAHIKNSIFTEPEFLTQLSQRTGCQLVIDLNSIYVNALNEFRREIRDRLNMVTLADQAFPLTALDRCRRWIDGIPASAVAELHVAGHNDCGNIVINDRSGAVTDPVWSLYSYALRRFGQIPTLIEWDNEIPALQVLLDEATHANALAQEALNPCAYAVDAPSAIACSACFQGCR